MVSPYTITPGMDFGPGLRGLAQSMRKTTEVIAKRKAEEKYEKMKEDATKVFATKDPSKIADFMITNPEMAQAMSHTYKFWDDETKKNYVESSLQSLSVHEEGKKAALASGPIPDAQGIIEEDLPPDPETMTRMEGIVDSRRKLLDAKGVPPEQRQHTEAFLEKFKQQPESTMRQLEAEIASLDPKAYKAWKEVYRPEEDGKGPTATNLKKQIDERQKLLDEGMSPEDPIIKAYDKAIFGEPDKDKGIAPSNIQKMMNERDSMIERLTAEGVEDPLEHPDIMAFNRKILGEKEKEFSPSGMKKLIDERETMAEELRSQGMSENEILENPYIKAYDNKIAGVDIDIDDLSDEEIDYWGQWVNLTGKMPSLGRGKQATKLRAAIAKSAAEQALNQAGVIGGRSQTPMSAALETIAKSADTKAIGSSITFLDKQMSAMGSFIQNMNAQADKMAELGKDLYNFDVRLFNMPRRFVMNKIIGSPLQAKWEMYLTEIESEIGKLAQGNPQSIAELSTTAQAKWDKIHDKNLSVKDTLSLIEETQHAARMRLDSIEGQLDRTRTRMRTREYPIGQPQDRPVIDTQEEYDALPSGSWYIDKQTGRPARKQ